jgi:ATP-dependent protease ClpP protease subunit
VKFTDQAESDAGTPATPTLDVGPVDAETLTPVLLQLEALAKAGTTHVTLRIDSPGGSIFTGLRFIRMVEDIRKAHGVRVSCVVDGAAYSMAAVILESPACDERLATSRSTFLFHNGKADGAGGSAGELASAARMLEAMNEALAALVAERMGMTPKQYRAKVAGGDWVMAAPEAIANHVIDGVVASASIAPPEEG